MWWFVLQQPFCEYKAAPVLAGICYESKRKLNGACVPSDIVEPPIIYLNCLTLNLFYREGDEQFLIFMSGLLTDEHTS